MAALIIVLGKIVGTFLKVILILPIYNKIKEKYRGKNAEAQRLIAEGKLEEANAILKELRFDLMNEMWIDFLLLCKGLWRTRITKKSLWMIGSAIVTYYTLKWTWAFVEPYIWEIVISTVVVTVLWYIYKFFQDVPAVKKSVIWMNTRLNQWTERGSLWVLSVVDDQEAYEAEKKAAQSTDEQVDDPATESGDAS